MFVSRRMSLALVRVAIAVVMVLGCGQPGDEPADAPSDPADAPALDASPGIPAIVQGVRPPALEEMQRDLGRTLDVAVLAWAEQPSSIAWALPTCATTYAFAAALRVQDMEEATPNEYPMGAFVAGSATMRASDDALAIVRYGRTESGILRDATKQSLGVEPEGTQQDT